jgi:phage head maturation protease
VNLGLTDAAHDMYEDIKTQNYSQMSFSFVVARGGEHFEDNGSTVTRVIDRIFKVYDTSAVAFPANPTTNIGVAYRDLFNGVIESRKAERLKAIKERALLKIKLNRR